MVFLDNGKIPGATTKLIICSIPKILLITAVIYMFCIALVKKCVTLCSES